jgi:syntaxin 1B/2/3
LHLFFLSFFRASGGDVVGAKGLGAFCEGFPCVVFLLALSRKFHFSSAFLFFWPVLCLAMNDLLSTFSGRKTGEGYDDDLETGPSVQMTGMAAGDKDLSRFFADIEKIKKQMDRIRELLVKLQEANEESKGVHKAQAMKALRDRMDADIAQVTKIARSIKAELEELDRGNAANRRVKGCEEGTPTDRTRTTITNNQRKKLKDLMGEFQALRERMMGEYKETIERRFFHHQNSLPFL